MNTIIVTGDSGGLGYEIIKKLLTSDNLNVIGISRRVNEEVEQLQKLFLGRYKHIDFDLSKPESVKDLYFDHLKELKSINGLVNNAAFAYDDLLTNANLNTVDEMFKINVYSNFILTKYVIRDMLLKNVQGSIVHISSISTKSGFKGLSMYAASKGAIEAFSLGVSREWGKRGIRSNCVVPGFLETNMTKNFGIEELEKLLRRSSLNTLTKLESVANTVSFLLSEESCSITGENIRVDSGGV